MKGKLKVIGTFKKAFEQRKKIFEIKNYCSRWGYPFVINVKKVTGGSNRFQATLKSVGQKPFVAEGSSALTAKANAVDQLENFLFWE